MGEECREEHPGPVEVERVEGAREQILQLDVEQPGEELEQRSAHEEEQRDPLQRVGDGADRRQGEEPGNHGPQFRQQDGDEDDPHRDVEPLGHPVQPVRAGRPGEQVEAQQPLVRRLVVHRVQIRVVGRVRHQARHEEQSDPAEQNEAEHGGEPDPAYGTAPEPGRRRETSGQGRGTAGGESGEESGRCRTVPTAVAHALTLCPGHRGGAVTTPDETMTSPLGRYGNRTSRPAAHPSDGAGPKSDGSVTRPVDTRHGGHTVRTVPA